MRLAVLITFVLLWFTNFVVLKRFYDVSVYEEYLLFWKMRGILYDGMFFCISLILFLSWKGIERALACFMVIITAGSLIDKSLFNITGYAFGDIVLVILGLMVSVILYGRSSIRKSEKLSS